MTGSQTTSKKQQKHQQQQQQQQLKAGAKQSFRLVNTAAYISLFFDGSMVA